MDGVGGAMGALQGALETQSDLASKVISSGAGGLAQQGGDAAGAAQTRASAMQEQGIGQKLNITV